MTFFEAIRSALTRFGVFTGRAFRPEFWWFALFVGLGHLGLNSLNIATPDGTVYLGASLSGAFGIATLLPLIAVTARRLHDAGRGAIELLWLLLPIAGLIVLVVHLAEPTRAPGPGTPVHPDPRT